MLLSQKVRDLRQAKGWSQEQLAKKAGVSQQLITKIETGKVTESRKLPGIAAALDLTVEQLLSQMATGSLPKETAVREQPIAFGVAYRADARWNSYSPEQKSKILEMVDLAEGVTGTAKRPNKKRRREELHPRANGRATRSR